MADVYTILKDVEKKYGALTPHTVVEEAQAPSHPLHGYFDWDNKHAAHAYRLHQARGLIAKVKVIYQNKKVDGFYNVTIKFDDESVGERQYVSYDTLQENPHLWKQVHKEAIRQIEYWQKKYEEYEMLKPIVDSSALEAAKKEIK